MGHYEDAIRAVFELQLDGHHHIQPYRSTKDGKVKWASIKMWPMPVRIHWLLPSLDTAHRWTSASTRHPLLLFNSPKHIADYPNIRQGCARWSCANFLCV